MKEMTTTPATEVEIVEPPAPPAAPALPPIDMKALKGFAPQLITDGAGLERVDAYLKRLATSEPTPGNRVAPLGLDTETNFTNDFYYRRLRTIQVGDNSEQFCIDLLSFADGDQHKLIGAQGLDGVNSAIFDPIKKVLNPYLCSSRLLKIGVNLPFEYQVLRWNLGMRIWHLYSCDLAERVIYAGSHSLKDYPFFSMAGITGRIFKKMVDKTLQKQFDLETPLTPEQVDYACLDVYLPIALRQQQMKVTTRDRLNSIVTIENDAIGPYADMHINGQNLDCPRWMKRIDSGLAEIKTLIESMDAILIPIVGDKAEVLENLQSNVSVLDDIYHSFDAATPEEMEACAAYKKKHITKEKEERAALKAVWNDLEVARRMRKAEARTRMSEVSKQVTVVRHMQDKCAGNALLNYNSHQQLLAAFSKMRGLTTIKATDDDTLLEFNDKPFIKSLRRFKKLKKDTGTYGAQWTRKWVTRACKEEGWLHPGDGRLHSLFNQLEAETGRSSSSKPNSQNLPQDDEVRACFICDPPNESVRVSICCDDDTIAPAGQAICQKCNQPCETKAEEQCIVTVDMAGAELRIIAELANASSWITAFAAGWDVHSVGTEILYPDLWPTLTVKSVVKPDGWTLEDSKTEKIAQFNDDGTPLMKNGKHVHVGPCAYFATQSTGDIARQKCDCPKHKKLRDGNKATNFLLAYGGGPSALADALGITTEAAKELMRLHESKFPDIWGYLKRSGELSKVTKEARSMFGRRRSFPEPTWEAAKDFFIQEHSDALELEDEVQLKNTDNFKKVNLRLPTDEEEYAITHRPPTSKEIASSLRGMYGSIERRGKNMCIQATNADIIKRAMGCGFDKDGKPYLWHVLPKFRARLISMVHDELIVSCPKRFGSLVLATVGDAFKRAAAEVMKKVVMEYDGHVAERWMK